MPIVVNKIQFINIYCQLNYELLIQKIAKCYALIMINKLFYKRKPRAENHYHSHCYNFCDPKTENQKYYFISHTSCGYFVLISYLLVPYGIGET